MAINPMKRARYTTWLGTPGFIFLIILCGLVYFPGLSGPFVFDDYTNLLDNTYVQITSLQLSELHRAAFSLQAGPLQRPVSMLSFGLNYFWGGGFGATLPFKSVNLVIHVLNGLLIYWLGTLILRRATELGKKTRGGTILRRETIHWYAGAAALLWVAHPIQLTSVLYIVQRMTSLAALFLLLALICYLKLRSGDSRSLLGRLTLVAGLCANLTLGAFSKESALLLPAFIMVVEFVLYPQAWPWRLWQRLTPGQRKTGLALGFLAAAGIAFIAIRMALPGYSVRDFDMSQRLMTEARVLFFYLGLIVVPRIDQFGLLHDDIGVSTSLFTPWSTLPSVIGIATLLVIGFALRRRWPLLSLGILWFFAAHLFESTVFALEIAHEHRNYVASWGAVLALIVLIDRAAARSTNRMLLAAVPVLFAVFITVTLLRVNQWSDAVQLYEHEAAHHPRSPGALAGFASLRNAQGDHAAAIDALRRASQLDLREPAYFLGMHMIAAKHGKQLEATDDAETLRRLSSSRISATTGLTLESLNRCILDSCASLQAKMAGWLNALLSANPTPDDASQYYYYLGRVRYGQGRLNEAVQALAESYERDRMYLLPLLELASIYIETRNLQAATTLLTTLREINQKSLHPRSAEIEQLEAALAQAQKRPG